MVRHNPTRAGLLLCLVSFTAPAQTVSTGEAGTSFVSLFNGRDLGQWVDDQQRWKAERSVLKGTSDGKFAYALVLGGRDYRDFELRFDLRVNQGAGGVLMRGPGTGPLGVELEVGPSVVRWLVNGSPFAVLSSVKPGEWNEYRVVCKGGSFELFQNDVNSAYRIVVGHLTPFGKLSLILPAGAPSDVELRNIRLKE